jgi:hypothetical protein
VPSRQVDFKQLSSGSAVVATVDPHGILSPSTYFTLKNVDALLDGFHFVSQVIDNSTIGFLVSSSATISPTNLLTVGTLIYPEFDTTGRPAYMYDSETDTWFLLASKVDTGANYVWYGTHLFTAPLEVDDEFVVNSQLFQIVNSASVQGSASVDGSIFVSGSASNFLNLTSASATIDSLRSSSGKNNFDTLVERDAFIATDGAECYVKEDGKRYLYKNSTWSELVDEVGFEDFFLLMGG